MLPDLLRRSLLDDPTRHHQRCSVGNGKGRLSELFDDEHRHPTRREFADRLEE